MPSQRFFAYSKDSNYINPGRDHYDKMTAEFNAEEAALVLKEGEVAARGPEIARQYGSDKFGTERLKFKGVARAYLPEDLNKKKEFTPKRQICLTFELCLMKGVSGWKVSERLADWVQLGGQLKSGWTITVKEDEIEKLANIWRQPDTKPIEITPKVDSSIQTSADPKTKAPTIQDLMGKFNKPRT